MGNTNLTPSYHRLTLTERITIQQGLDQNLSVSCIAAQLGKSVSTIKREIERNGEFVASKGNDCLHKKNCKERNACLKACGEKLCKFCRSVPCYTKEHCSNYIKGYCDRTNSSPHVCNGCPKSQNCPYEKFFYRAGAAEKLTVQIKRAKNRQFRQSDEAIRQIDAAISPLIKNGMSPTVALNSLKEELCISRSTLYRMIDAGVLSVRNIDLPEKVGRRRRRPAKRRNKDAYSVLLAEKQGHMFEDYLRYLDDNPETLVVEMDCVEGRKTDKEAILSLHWKEFHMQLYYILEVHDARNVVKMLDVIEGALGLELFRECFPVILTDNGEEFSDIEGMERSNTVPGADRTRVFFCEPNRSDQKGSCERNHRLLRRIIPKYTDCNDTRNRSIHELMQPDMTLVSNHINSYRRPEMGFVSPYTMAKAVLPDDFFIMLGLEVIPDEQIILKPELIYHK